MSRIKKLLLLIIISIGILRVDANPAITSTAFNPDENLIGRYHFVPALSYRSPKKTWRSWLGQNFTIKNGELRIPQKANGKTNSAGLYFDYSTVLAAKLKIKFNYTLQGGGSVAFCGKHFSLTPGADKTFVAENPVKLLSGSGSVRFFCRGKNGNLTVKNLTVLAVKPENISGKPLVFDGSQVKSICYSKTNFKKTFLDQRAANMMQKQLYIAGAGVLPIKILKKDQKISNGIVIGQAAKKYFNAKSINKIGDGGYALKVSKGIAAIYGKNSYSNPAGVFTLLKKLGFFYLTNNEYILPAEKQLKLGSMLEIKTPAIAIRLDAWFSGGSVVTGMSDPIYQSDLGPLGSFRARHHTMPSFIGWKEFKDTDRDIFAMQEDGIRRPAKRGDIHYCFSNKKLQELSAKRIDELLDANIISDYLSFTPGDGMNLACRCENCKKLGNPADRLIYFLNSILRKLKPKHPDLKLVMAAYTDTREVPVKQKPDPNIIVLYCPYEPVWMNHLQTYHRDNAEGWKQLKEWTKGYSKNMGAFVYPSNCGERLNIWPAFYANYDKFKCFAKHHFKVLEFCGLRPWQKTLPGSGIFNPAQRYVLMKVLWNPDLDFEKEIDNFFRLYYGKAAPAFRKLFDLLHAEVKKQDWSQNTEKIIRGFVTQKLTDKGMKFFAEAEKAVGNVQSYRDRAQREKLYLLWSYLSDINRANGKLKAADFSKYAKYLSEFCRLGKKFTILNLGRISFKKWFWDTAMIKISTKGYWYDQPIIAKLIANPEKTLGKSIPRVQVKTAYGYMVPAKGMFGGRSLKCSWLRSKAVPTKQLYRASSGFGMTQMLLSLPKKPSKPIVIKVNGIDNEKKDIALMQLLVNGKSIYKGKVPWGKEAWTYESFTVPAKLWKTGDNTIQFLNITPDKKVFSQGRAVHRNYYWGWYIIEDCQFHL